MDALSLFSAYAAERRHAPPAGYRLDPAPGLTRFTPEEPDLDGVVLFADLAEAETEASILAQIAHFRALGRPWEWKVHGFDRPPDLAARLLAQGFTPGEEEALLVRPIAHVERAPKAPAGVHLETVTTPAGRRAVVALQEQIWGRPFPWLEAALSAAADRTALFCAWRGNEAVGTGWVEFPPGARFAELRGGAVRADHRGRGLYSVLLARRVEEARRRGVEFLAVDAGPQSRPLLLGKGFQFVCSTTPFVAPV
jgi:GNAT superfamily N-acetyltransferase